MVLLLSMSEANRLARQLRRTRGSTNRLHLTRSAYRASGLVHWPVGWVRSETKRTSAAFTAWSRSVRRTT